MKNQIVRLTVIAFVFAALSALPAFGQVQVSVRNEYVQFQKGEHTFVASLQSPTKLVAVEVIYPTRDFSENIVSPSGSYTDNHNNRYADQKEWEKLEREWKSIQKQVTFGRVDGSIVVDTFRHYTFTGTTTLNNTHQLVHTFKVKYLNTGKEGVEVMDYDLFKVHPEGSEPFLLGRDNGRLVPVALDGKSVKVAKN